MILFFFIMKRVKGGSFVMGKYPLMKNLATLSLGPKKSLALIEVCDQWILVGVGSENISFISNVEKPSDLSQLNSSFPKEVNLFDSFLSKAGLNPKHMKTAAKNNEQ